MLRKWKLLLENWINCYFDDSTPKDFPVTIESLVNIITHLRQNFNLDESKSSLLDAITVQDFILEKYPSFRFENGKFEPTTDEEIYMAATLLLYFVCVNSKNVNIKSAMCNKLCTSDQETILKFSKSLMQCSQITSSDVLSAITEACGQDVAAAGINHKVAAETPPALRSLHSEMRRLQAALDAECFDRNYLQEELTRSNLKIEKLLKDKEQYKQDIVNLKAKISTCCGQENETKGAEISSNNSAKLLKQLDETEQRLVNLLEQLEEVQLDRDTYKNKLDELKLERDKWFAISQEESIRASQLVEELETERRKVHSLQELVTELRQHNRLNGLDSSQLECDDVDTSNKSFQHNSSICSEVCANIIEVQLSEERAKVVQLTQQMQSLQDEINEFNAKSQEESRNLTQIISDKDTDIFNLKHRINEEIEERNTLKAHFENELTKLNNEVNELEQRLRDTGENSRRIIDSKMKEIQILQEEKLSILQSLSDEITKFENIIKDLKVEIDAEKVSKIKMRDEYENQMMKLKEKVSNRNNELVELQNKIFEKGEIIEELQSYLRKEKEMSTTYFNDVQSLTTTVKETEKRLQEKADEVTDLTKQLQQYVMNNDTLNKDINHLKSCLTKYDYENKHLEECNEKLTTEIKNRDAKINQLQNDIDYQETIFNNEKKKLNYNLDEINATVDALKNQLQNEIQYKISIENERRSLSEDVDKLQEELTVIKSENIKLDKNLKEISELNKQQNAENVKLNVVNKKLNEDLIEKETILKQIEEKFAKERVHFEEEFRQKEDIIVSTNQTLKSEVAEKNDIKNKLDSITEANTALLQEFNEKKYTIVELQDFVDKLSNTVGENNKKINELKDIIAEKNQALDINQKNFDIENNKLLTKLNEMDKSLNELRIKSNNCIENKDIQIELLGKDIEELQKSLQILQDNTLVIEKEKTSLLQQFDEMNANKSKIEKEYLNKCAVLNNTTAHLSDDIVKKNEEINKLKQQVETLLVNNSDKTKDINILQSDISKALENEIDKDKNIKDLCLQVEELKSLLNNTKEEFKNVIDNNKQIVDGLQKENKQLHYTIEEDNSTYEIIVKEKDYIIETLEKQLQNKVDILEQLLKEHEQEKFVAEKTKNDLQEQINIKDAQIEDMTNKIHKIESELQEKETVLKILDSQINILSDEKDKLTIEINSLRETCTESAVTNDLLKEHLTIEKATRDCLETEKRSLIEENDQLITKLSNIECEHIDLKLERDSLLNEKAILVQQLMDEKSVLKIADEGKEALLIEKREIDEKLKGLKLTNNLLVEEKECLTQQLVEEKLSKELAEQEKKNINEFKTDLESKLDAEMRNSTNLQKDITILMKDIETRTMEYEKEKDLNVTLNDNINNLKQKVEKLTNENESLASAVTALSKELFDHNSIEEHLSNDKAVLEKEKIALLKLCDELKGQMQEIRDTLNREINNKQGEIEKLVIDFNSIKSDYKTLEESNINIHNVLNVGLKEMYEKIEKVQCSSDILDKINSFNKQNIKAEAYCNVLLQIIRDLTSELALKQDIEKMLKDRDTVAKDMLEQVKNKDKEVAQFECEVQTLHKAINGYKNELTKQSDSYNSILESKLREIAQLQSENQSLNTELTDLKVQLDVKVHSLKDKLVNNENLTDKLKETYESQIDNLNMMISKLTNYLKEKTAELETMRVEKERLQHVIEDKYIVIKSLEDDLKTQKQNQDKLISEFESERLVLKNMVTVTESVMEDQKSSLNNIIIDHVKANEALAGEIKALKALVDSEKSYYKNESREKEQKAKAAFETAFIELCEERKEKEAMQKDHESQIHLLESKISSLDETITEKTSLINSITIENETLVENLEKYKKDIILLEERSNEWKIIKDNMEVDFENKFKKLNDDLDKQRKHSNDLEELIEFKAIENNEMASKVQNLEEQIMTLVKDKKEIELDNIKNCNKLTELKADLEKQKVICIELNSEKERLLDLLEKKKNEISTLEDRLQTDLAHQNKENTKEKINLKNKCSILEEYQDKAEAELDKRQKEINVHQEEIKTITAKGIQDVADRDRIIAQIEEERDIMINRLNEHTKQLQNTLNNLKNEIVLKETDIAVLTKKLSERSQRDDIIKELRKENEQLFKEAGQMETFAVSPEQKDHKYSGQAASNHRDSRQQVDNTSTDTHSSIESYKTISDLEKIILDKNRTITTLQSDITYLKSLIAESENKLLDVSKDLELSKENCQQLSSQLKKIVHLKNEEITDLKKQVTKMSATENRASQIIKVSAKYQAIILKRIAEIKSNTVLKELTNFGNTNAENEFRRSLNAGTITMEDLENFLETTERHIRRCSEKQIALQKERDRLIDVNKINESEIISMRKFLTELSVSIKTFSSVRELYSQKLSRVISLQRTVRREILSLDGHITDSTMCKLERGYAAVMQDLSECALNLERWIERSISRTISAEKIKQAFTSDVDRASLVSGSFQNTNLEVQLDELQNSFQKLLEEVARATKGEGAKDPQSVTVMEVRAEYEDKLNRMKAKMRDLCHEQIALFKEKHRQEVEKLEMEVKRAHHKLRESSRAYEEHIKSLTTDLWNVGEKFLVKSDEADWLRKKQKSGSLMSLQHVHSGGLAPPPELCSRPSDTHSLRSLPVTKNKPKEGRALQMSDEEGEVFDNRWLRELASPRLSELRRRNTLCPPHLRSCYPAETQFAPAMREDEIKCTGNMSVGGKQRKEVGITVYKKPGPPTPSKQAGRLSATDSELRQSLRVEADPSASRKTSTPSRIRSLFRSSKNDTTEGTPRSRRLSNIFRKK